MAERLAEIDERNRALEAQLLTIQDEERAEIARDLHDEIGPHLFAVALDADMIGQMHKQGETQAIPDQVRSIQSAVSYMQRQVRELIARLRPTRAAELGLEAAIGDLVTFWQARQPEVEFVSELDGADTYVPEPLRDVIYRVVQEFVANALRHAQTTRLSIAVTRTSDRGYCHRSEPRRVRNRRPTDLPGLGLVSMRERVQAAGGSLAYRPSEPRLDRSCPVSQPARADGRMNILIVDDHAIVRAGLRRLLRGPVRRRGARSGDRTRSPRARSRTARSISCCLT